MVSKATGIVTTVAGTGELRGGSNIGDGGSATSAFVSGPRGVFIDRSGNKYIADAGHYRIRFIDQATGIITTFAGTGAEGSSGDGGPASSATFIVPTGVAGYGDALYIVDGNNKRIRKITSSCATGMVVSGLTCVPAPTHAPTSASTSAPTSTRTASKPPTSAHQPAAGSKAGSKTSVLRKRATRVKSGNIDVEVDVDVAVRAQMGR